MILKNCPFCAGRPFAYDHPPIVRICCPGPANSCVCPAVQRETMAEAAMQWNRRTTQREPIGSLEGD